MVGCVEVYSPSHTRRSVKAVVGSWWGSRVRFDPPYSILYFQLDLVGIPLELWRVHGVGPRGQGAELAGDLGPGAIADAVAAAGEPAHEQAHPIVAQLHVSPQAIGRVAALQGHRLETGRLHVLEHDVFVVV